MRCESRLSIVIALVGLSLVLSLAALGRRVDEAAKDISRACVIHEEPESR